MKPSPGVTTVIVHRRKHFSRPEHLVVVGTVCRTQGSKVTEWILREASTQVNYIKLSMCPVCGEYKRFYLELIGQKPT